MLKNKNIYFIILATIVLLGLLLFSKNKKPKKVNIMTHPRTNPITLKEIEKKYSENNKWILYIGNSFCGDCLDFRKNSLDKIMEVNPNIQIHYVDFIKRNEMNGDWDQIIGVKNDSDVKKTISSSSIENFTFMYTPTILILEGNKALEVWEGFGGGNLRSSRYFRNDATQKEQGYKNAIEDVDILIKKHFK